MHIRRPAAAALSLSLVAALSIGCQGGEPAPAPAGPLPTAGTPAPSSSAPLVPGQDSAGDPYVPGDGNGGYDVRHYSLQLKIVPSDARKALDAVATITAHAQREMTAFNLDLAGLEVSRVEVDGRKADFSHEGEELVVQPSATIAGGGDFTVTVAYSGTPQPVNDPILGRYGWIRTADGVAVACQPSGAHTWFPGNDHPSDKATFDLALTVPQHLTAVTNGESGRKTTRNGLTTTRWKVEQPMAPYLAMLAVGDFEVKEGVTPGGIPILVAVDSSVRSPSVEDFYRVKAQITDEWVKLFGPYPFGSTGGVVDNADVSFALETQSRSIYGDFDPTQTIIAHELAHQWFGDSVSVTQWKDIWLNEGFASYAEWIWGERMGGQGVQSRFDDLYQGTPPTAWQVRTGDPGRDELFNGFAVYDRGAMTLHALRTKIGDDVFFSLLRRWAKDHEYGNATTAQFVALAEGVSGQELSAFFDAWLYQPSRPPR
ncbi:M1 family metallopeptidase [Actinocorallia populi]|uniref:M1 family metallopeptidase n=1 Tax=Actinocorallia populi TaxID=2079200 RepID=UPI001E601A3C|nr:M1 family metallopeptidase [Actinocorallia populi]